jgi:CubicO group peptidase (beta-lactamase class C family)
LVERGLITVDDPIAAHFPEFARHGQAGITIRHVLRHRSGLPTAGTSLGGSAHDDALAAFAYLTNRRDDLRHMADVADALLGSVTD